MHHLALWLVHGLLGLSAPALAFESVDEKADKGADAAEDDEEDVPEWDIEAAHGPRFTWETTLTEGTWISVDVHPRGNRVVFDLLGDLWELPLSGGTATALTTGPAWDQDPRYSPDGKKLLYASDKGGNQEIWVRDMETGEAEAFTSGAPERFSEATFSPDGQWIVARKRITDTRSIGMCELWLFHIDGGDGIQLTKTDSMPFPAEATFSLDGTSLYFSSTPWRFQYDRNPHKGIFDLHVMDLDSGEVQRLTAESGSAMRPAVRPGTGEIALLRRQGTDTVLEIFDPRDGSRRTLATGFEHDNQEGFALNGLYPHTAWTPSGKELVIWDDGTLWRVDARTGKRRAIPFSAAVSHEISGLVRHAQPVSRADEITAKLVRWPSLSPDGKKVLFEAFGRLWVQEVKDTEAKAITSGDTRVISPRWSPDSTRIAYAAWHDDRQGDVRVHELRTGKESRVSRRSAQYLGVSWSPDGTELAWLRGSGAPLRGHDPSNELWMRLEIASADGEGEVHDVMSWGHAWGRTQRIGFSPDGDRLLLVEAEGASEPNTASKTVLKSYDRNGKDPRTLLRWTRALEVALSPDGTQVAWTEEHRVHSALIPHAGSVTVELGPEDGPIPVKSHGEGAEWLSWSGGDVTSAQGPTLKKGDTEIQLSASLPRGGGTGIVAYTHARVVTMGDAGVLEDVTVLVDGDRIRSVGAAAPPLLAKKIDATGKTLIPGLIDVHAHLHFGGDTQPQRSWRHEANLAYGVTSVHDPSAFDDTVFATAERIETGLQKGPRVTSTGGVIYGAKSKDRSRVDSLEDAQLHVARKKAKGATSIKSYQQPARRQRQWLLQAARDQGLNVYPEGGGDLTGNLTMLLDGHTGIEHALPQAPLYADVRGLYRASGAGYTPTLLVAYGGLSGEHFFFQTENLLENEKFLRFTPEEWVNRNVRRREVLVNDGDWYFSQVAKSAADLQSDGVPVLVGGHGQVQGMGVHWEIWALGEHMEPVEALRAATLDAAWYIGRDRDLGSIEAGKLADMVLIDGNPLEDLRATTAIVEVMQGGVRYDGDTLDVLK
jgi:imidazolonepropionase-like amidohydrolase/Tol biopolymer transport system component